MTPDPKDDVETVSELPPIGASITARDQFETIKKITYVILGLVVALSFLLLFDYWWHQPAVPSLAGSSEDQLRVGLDTYKNLSGINVENVAKMFDLMISKALLPLLTALIGFLVGRRQS